MDGFLYYVMPYIEGETLRDKLNRETQLGIDEAVRITSEVADALDYAHRHGVIHRDIKPENILLHDGRPMVADFGIALALSAAAGGRMTETGMSLGTPHYMSPEQATADKDISNRSDIYSLGSVLYEMLTGEPPHMGNSAQQIIMKIVTEEAAPVTKLRKSVPANVAAAVAKAVEKLPADRFETAKAFADALNNPAFATQAITAGSFAGVRTGRPRVDARRPVPPPRSWRWRPVGQSAAAAAIPAASVRPRSCTPRSGSRTVSRFRRSRPCAWRSRRRDGASPSWARRTASSNSGCANWRRRGASTAGYRGAARSLLLPGRRVDRVLHRHRFIEAHAQGRELRRRRGPDDRRRLACRSTAVVHGATTGRSTSRTAPASPRSRRPAAR